MITIHKHAEKDYPFWTYACTYTTTYTDDLFPKKVQRWCLDDGEYYYPIIHCPYCGVNLEEWAKEEVP